MFILTPVPYEYLYFSIQYIQSTWSSVLTCKSSCNSIICVHVPHQLEQTVHCGRRSIWICVGRSQYHVGWTTFSWACSHFGNFSQCKPVLCEASILHWVWLLGGEKKHSMKHLFICLLLCSTLYITFVHSKPTIYKINENDKLEPGRKWTQYHY